MILFLNGSFGVGKTTVARALAAHIPGASIYDPERWGFVLQRLPVWMFSRRRRVDDFQELARGGPSWRAASGARTGARAS